MDFDDILWDLIFCVDLLIKGDNPTCLLVQMKLGVSYLLAYLNCFCIVYCFVIFHVDHCFSNNNHSNICCILFNVLFLVKKKIVLPSETGNQE